jgi:hypothetical protein
MVEYWSGFYDVGRAHGLPRRLVSDTLTAIVMSESWFDHRAVNVGYQGQRDFGLAQASEYARKRMDAWFHAGLVDVSMSDEDYFNPWMGTRFVAIWMARLIEETNGDLDFAVRAYHRGTHRAFDDRGDVYLAYVRRRRDRFIRNLGAPQAWNYLWQQDRKDRVAAWPWIVRPRNVDRRSYSVIRILARNRQRSAVCRRNQDRPRTTRYEPMTTSRPTTGLRSLGRTARGRQRPVFAGSPTANPTTSPHDSSKSTSATSPM